MAARFRGQDLFDLEPEERARLGLFLSFQSPIAIPGVSNIDFLRLAYNSRQKALGKPEVEPLQFYGGCFEKSHQQVCIVPMLLLSPCLKGGIAEDVRHVPQNSQSSASRILSWAPCSALRPKSILVAHVGYLSWYPQLIMHAS